MVHRLRKLNSYSHRPGSWLNPGRFLVFSLVLIAAWLLIANTPEPAAGKPLHMPELVGKVRNTDGKPVVNAWITDGTNYTFTDSHGLFVFPEGKVAPGTRLTVSGSGYMQALVSAPDDGTPIDLTMTSYGVRGIYFDPRISYSPEMVKNFINIAKTTEVNAVVIDVKEGMVFFETTNSYYQRAGMVWPIMDLPWLLKEFRSNGIYTIARIVVFKDNVIAEKHPELAVRDTQSTNIWRDQTGSGWLNATNPATWEPNIQLAEEVIALGFDEVQYDYVRFPTDGNMARADITHNLTERDRQAAIDGFLAESRERIIPLGGRQSADVFGYTTVVEHDLGIGQTLTDVAEQVDYLSPMIYPSHWPQGSIHVPGHPNEYPYQTVNISMSSAIAQLDGNKLQLRPWLQDFAIYGLRGYGQQDVYAQIAALRDLGINSWMLWSFTNWYHTGALLPDTKPDALPTATPRPDKGKRSQSVVS